MVHLSKLVPDFTNAVIGNRRYKCVEKIGSGAFGVVYLAIDQKPQEHSDSSPTKYAIKIMCKPRSDASGVPTDQHLVPVLHSREILHHKIVSSHPNIVTCYETFEDTSFTYLVLQYCPGRDLYSRISQYRPYWRNDRLVKKHFLQILDAVQHIHSHAIFHRDLKPENILCSIDEETLYLTDFGLSTDQFSSMNHGCGSAAYMSPECIGGVYEYDPAPYSPRHADIWSLGVILINILVMSQPWMEARVEDPEFCDFAMDTEYFLKKYPISRPANRLLRRMMKFQPLSRLSISDIKESVQNMDTFFMSDGELNGPLGTECNRHVAYECAARQTPSPAPTIISDHLQEIDITSAIESSRSHEGDFMRKFELDLFKEPVPLYGYTWNEREPTFLRYKWASPQVRLEDKKPGFDAGNRKGPNGFGTQSPKFVIGSLSSGSDSIGPITPETRAVDPKIHVGEIPPLDNSGEDENQEEVDLGDFELAAAKEKFFDVKKILDTPPVWHLPERCVIHNPIANDQEEKRGKRKWFVKDFRNLRFTRKQVF